MSTLPPQQFEALADLSGLRAPASKEAARRVLVEGERPVDIYQSVGLTLQGASQAVRRARLTLEKARIAVGLDPTENS